MSCDETKWQRHLTINAQAAGSKHTVSSMCNPVKQHGQTRSVGGDKVDWLKLLVKTCSMLCRCWKQSKWCNTGSRKGCNRKNKFSVMLFHYAEFITIWPHLWSLFFPPPLAAKWHTALIFAGFELLRRIPGWRMVLIQSAITLESSSSS